MDSIPGRSTFSALSIICRISENLSGAHRRIETRTTEFIGLSWTTSLSLLTNRTSQQVYRSSGRLVGALGQQCHKLLLLGPQSTTKRKSNIMPGTDLNGCPFRSVKFCASRPV